MKLYTLDNIKFNSENKLYDLFDTKIAPDDDVFLKTVKYMIMAEDAMRLDLVCIKVYGNCDYLDEIMTLNGIVDPFSVSEGDIIDLFDPQSVMQLYIEETSNRNNEMVLAVKNKETTIDPNRQKEVQLPPSAKRSPVMVINADDGTFSITNKP